jgi:hypothetical protein
MGLYSDLMDYEWDLPSAYVKIAIDHGHRNSGFTQLENGGSFHSKL